VSGTVGGFTLSTNEIPSHTHDIIRAAGTGKGATGQNFAWQTAVNNTANVVNAASARGGGGSHNHSFSGAAINLSVQYVDVIIATKN
jgi:hypothetical protein